MGARLFRGVGTPLKLLTRAQRRPTVALGMALPSAQQAGASWLQGAQGAQPKWLAGVNATPLDPTQLAAQAANKMLLGVQNAVNSGYWARRLADVGKGGWQAACAAKQNNYGTGIAAGQNKYEAGYTAFWNYMGPKLQTIQAMPKVTLADSIARATTFITDAAAYQKP